jgi:hypothetical protein
MGMHMWVSDEGNITGDEDGYVKSMWANQISIYTDAMGHTE